MSPALRHTLIFVGVLTLVRLGALGFESLDLGPDETQYWFWAQTPDFGYFSKPPMIAWVIWFAGRIVGEGEFGVRFAAPLFHAGTALVLFALARKLYDDRAALWSAIAYVTLPGVSFSSALITTDVPLLFFWALALYFLVEALDKPTLGRALALGVAIGLGLLSKYSMAYFLLCAGISAIFVPGVRKLSLSPFGLVTLLTASVVFAPNIAWNAARGWPTFVHTASNADLGQDLVHPVHVGDFLASQFGVFGPIFFGALLVIAAPVLKRRQGGAPDRLLLGFSLPVLLVACGIAFLSRANANWAAPAYIAATPLVVESLIANGRRILFTASLYLHVIAAIVIPAVLVQPALADVAGFSNALKRVRGWTELGRELSLRATEAPYTAVLVSDRELMGELLYYIRPRKIPVVMWDFDWAPRNHYELASRINKTTGARVLYVSLEAQPLHILRRFSHIEPLGPETVRVDDKHTHTVYLFDLEGFKPRPSEHN